MDRLNGMLLGLATGDALGMPVEFKQVGQFDPIKGMTRGGPFNLEAGFWTDDTSMALCLADSLLAKGGYDSFDVMDRYARWYHNGYRSSTGKCFDIGAQTRDEIERYEISKVVGTREKRVRAAGNGALMRLAPVVMASLAANLSIEETARLAKISGRETHYSHEAESAAAIFGAMLWRAASAKDKREVAELPEARSSFERKLLRTVTHSAGLEAHQLRPTGYVVDTLEAASWAFLSSSSFAEGALKAVNLGGDSDTIGAVYGQLAGAFYGTDGIPKAWRNVLADYKEILDVATRLSALTEMGVVQTRFEEDSVPHRVRELE